jgi:uncharacterized membrane protein YkvA (DUF1232 family)
MARDADPPEPMPELPPGTDLVPFDPEKLRRDEDLVRKGFWDKLRRTLGKVPFTEDALAAFYCATDPRTPRWVQAVLLGALAYFILPADVIPDVIAGLGFTDDASVLLAAIGAVRSNISSAHRDKARDFLRREAPEETRDG